MMKKYLFLSLMEFLLFGWLGRRRLVVLPLLVRRRYSDLLCAVLFIAEVLSGTPAAPLQRDDCTFPNYCDDDAQCAQGAGICDEPYYGGWCYMRLNCCICYE